MCEYGISKFSNSDTTYIYHYGIIKETCDALLYNTDFGHIWIPKNKLEISNTEIFAIPTWFANKKGIVPNKKGKRNG